MSLLARLALLAPALFPGGPVRPQEEVNEPPSVVLFIADDVSWPDVWPHVPTPNVERLAAAGVTFRRAYAMPNCITSRYATFYGRLGRREGIGADHGSFRAPPTPLPTIAGTFRDAGYATAAFGKWHLPPDPTDHANVVAAGVQHLFAGSVANLKGRGGRGYRRWQRIDDGEVEVVRDYPTTAMRDAFLRWWKETEGPKFAWVAFHAPHQPLHDPPSDVLPEGYEPGEGVGRLRAQYEAMVVSVDRALGEMLAAIDPEHTLVGFFGDNGTPPIARRTDEERGRLKGTTFEGGVRVPLVLRGPGVARGRESEALVSVMDWFPTLAELAGVPVPEGGAADGVSFAEVARDPGHAGRRGHVFVERYEQAGPEGEPYDEDVAVITPRYKLRRTGGEREDLFDLEQDPEERSPVVVEGEDVQGVLEHLRGLLDALPPRRQ